MGAAHIHTGGRESFSKEVGMCLFVGNINYFLIKTGVASLVLGPLFADLVELLLGLV